MSIEINMEKLERQAKLSLQPEERLETERELRQILLFAQVLTTLDEKNEPVSDERESVLRTDEIVPSMPRAALLQNAPEQRENCFALPRVLE